MKGPISYYGGKAMMAKKIVAMIPKHTTYVEPFFGGGSIFWEKEPSPVEIVNDMNKELVNFFIQVKTNNEALRKFIVGTMHSRADHKDAWIVYNNPHLFDEVRRAWAVWALATMGFSSMLSESFGTSVKSDIQQKKIANKRNAFGSQFSDRLERVTIENRDAIRVIQQYDTDESFHYCDPPYFNSDCGHYAGYNENNFKNLLETLANVRGKFILSSYPSEILSKYVKRYRWKQEMTNSTVTVARQKSNRKIKTEVLTWNY